MIYCTTSTRKGCVKIMNNRTIEDENLHYFNAKGENL